MAKRRGHREGSIFQRAEDGLWVGVISLGWANGKRRRKTVYGPTQADVREQLAKLIRERDQGFTVATKSLTFAAYCDQWIKHIQHGTLAPGTKENYELYLRRYAIPVIGKKRLDKLSALDIEAVVRELDQQGKAPRTIRQLLVTIRMALKQAVLWDLIPRNVATLVASPKVRPYEALALNDDQIGQFLDAARDHRLHALFLVAVMLGPRMGELLGLRWEDVNLDAREMHIRQALVRSPKGAISFAPPKTAGSRRMVILPELCVDALRVHRKEQLKQRLLAGGRWTDLDLVFPSSIGTPLDDRLLTREFRALLDAAGCPRIRFHDLRHTAVTSMVLKGVPPHVVASIVGHSKITMTLGTYAKVFVNSKTDAADLMDAAFGKPAEVDKVSS